MPVQSRIVLETHLIIGRSVYRKEIDDVVVSHALFAFDAPAPDFFIAGVLVVIKNEIFVHGVPTVVRAVNAGLVGGLDVGGLIVYDIPTSVIGGGDHGIDPINVPYTSEEDAEHIVDL